MIVVYDLETLKDFFLYIDIKLDTDEFNIFEASRFQNDISKLIEYLKTLQGQIGFNNLSFDAQVQEYIIENAKHWIEWNLPGHEIASLIHDYSNEVIRKANSREWPDYRDYKLSVRQVDLYKVWHFDNEAKRTSLKWLQYMTDWDNIEDMPINHNDSVKDEKTAKSIIGYCKNDCLSTRHFYNITRGKTSNSLYIGQDKLQLRKDVKAEFGFTCTNFNDVKIGDEINKVNYLNATGLDKYELKNLKVDLKPFTFGDCFPSYMHFESSELNIFINSIKDVVVDINSKEQYFQFKFGSTKYTLAKGGLHSNDSPRLVIPPKDYILRDADVQSMYPNCIRKRRLYPSHLGERWLDGYTSVIELRLKAKDDFKITKDPKYQSIMDAFKLALNGGSFGKTAERFNWQYDPFVTFCTTLGCQIDLIMLIESLELSGIKVISANTDGVVSLFHKNEEDIYNKVCKEWEKKVGNHDLGILEYADYSILAQRSVNDYIAVKIDGKAKHKGGTFTIYHELHKNKSYRIIALALDAYYTKGLNPRTFITSNENIFDFCAGMRTKGDWFLQSSEVINSKIIKKKLQKTNRYYTSNKGSKLIKCHPDGRSIQEDAGKWLSTVYNKHEQKDIKDYDINYNFYVKKTYEIISEIQPEITDENFTQLRLF